MGRRKKEPESAHREKIAGAAGSLFAQKGMEGTTMDDIAAAAGYSKATLYVYFKNKEEIVDYLVLQSMRMLLRCIREAVRGTESTRKKYDRICDALTQYQEQFPLYFTLALGEIRVDPESGDCPLVERETYEAGENMIREIAGFMEEGMEAGELKPDIPVVETVFLYWASMTGVIQMAANKQEYIGKAMHMTRRQFLRFSFDRLYSLIGREEKK